MNEIITWLLDGPVWIQNVTERDLLGKKVTDENQEVYFNLINQEPLIKNLIASADQWEQALLQRHNDASHPIHKLSFLADLGFTKNHPAISSIAERILNHQDPNGPFLSMSNYPVHFGGSGKNEWLWALCDAPILTYALIKFGYADETPVNNSLNFLISLGGRNGWPCRACEKMGNFRGPGKKDDPCPYANLIMLKAIAASGKLGKNEAVSGTEVLLDLWANSQEKRPYLFKMGTDFRKLKVPFVWYDILHFTEVLSQFPQAVNDSRFKDVISVIKGKSDENGRYYSESIWTKWKGWEFCQKKEPSRWVTFCAQKIFNRLANSPVQVR